MGSKDSLLAIEPQAAFEDFLQIYPESIRELVRAGLDELRAEAAALGFEVLRAERNGLSYADAARTPGYTLMARVHFGTTDFLQFELPGEIQEVVRQMMRRAREVNLDHVDRFAFAIAGASDLAVESALMRFLIYQCLRLNVWVISWPVREAAELEAAGVLLELDVEAEERLRERLAMVTMHRADVRPQVVLLAELFEFLHDSLRQHRDLIRHEGGPFLKYMNQMVTATKIARTLDAADAVLLRNEIDAAMQRDSLQLLPLVERHPLVLTSVDAAKQRRRRLHRKLAAGEDARPSRPRLIDMLQDILGEVE